MTIDEISDEILELDSPIDRLGYLVELGQSLSPFPDELRTEEHRVLGCQSMVWLVAREVDHRLQFLADSDAPMVRGLIAILMAVYNDKTPAEILAFPIEELLLKLKLKSFLTPMRSNGLYSMVKRIRALAELAQTSQLVHQAVDSLRTSLPSSEHASERNQAESATKTAAKTASPARTASHASANGSRPTVSANTSDSESGLGRSRRDFPILSRVFDDGRPLVYLDSAASTQRPRAVLSVVNDAYERYYSNVHRGAHVLAAETTERYEGAREAVRHFLHAKDASEIIFTSGTTASINLVARSWGDANLTSSDEVLLTEMEHHSNIVPWQQLAERTGCKIRWLPVGDDFELALDELDQYLTPATKIFAVTALSNTLGTINPIPDLIRRAHRVGAVVLVDAAQAAPHQTIDVQAWDVDFVAFSGHKMLAPSGIGVLYGRQSLLEKMPPFHGGGSMIRRVTKSGFEPADLPYKFEAGTPPIVPAIGLGTAIEYLDKLGMNRIHDHERALTYRAHELLREIPGLKILGPAPDRKGGIVSFNVEGLHADGIAKVLDVQGIAVRAGHHCTMPLHERFQISASCRASFYFYNTMEEIARLADGVREAVRVLKGKV